MLADQARTYTAHEAMSYSLERPASDWVDFESYISKLTDSEHVAEEADLYDGNAIQALYNQLWYLAACKTLQRTALAGEASSEYEGTTQPLLAKSCDVLTALTVFFWHVSL